jgi:hypothetical protein
MAREQMRRAAGGILGKRLIAPVYTQNRQRSSISSVRINDKLFQTTERTVEKCEMDTHAENCVAGSNFLVCEFDGTTCEVTPFTDQYQSMKGVPIVSAATAWTDEETGETIILHFNQVLWYGDKLNQSLINPNQLRHRGIPVCDDITDQNRRFGIDLYGELFIPFEMKGTTIYFDSRVPTKWKMQNCRIIVVTDDSSWDPANVTIAVVTTSHRCHKMVDGQSAYRVVHSVR